MKEIQSLLKILSDGLKTIVQVIEAISEQVDQIAELKTAEKPKSKTRAAAAPKKKPARKTVAKAPKKKDAKAPTAAEMVYKVISSSKKGVDTSTLMKMTGYDRKKIANMVYRLNKQDKIKTVQKGVYVKV